MKQMSESFQYVIEWSDYNDSYQDISNKQK